MKYAKLFAVIGAGALALTACTGGGTASQDTKSAAPDKTSSESTKLSGEISFQTWSLKNDRFTPYFEKLIADFQNEHPGTTIKWMDQPGEGYEDKVLQQANADELPDVVNLPPGYAAQLAKAGMVENLETVNKDVLKEYVPGGISAYQFPGVEGTYGYPWYLGTDMNWFNTELLEKAGVSKDQLPKTMDELFETADKVAKATNGEVKMISNLPDADAFANAGVKFQKDDGTYDFNTPEGVKLVQRWKDAYANGSMTPEALNADWTGNAMLYKQGRTAWTTASAGFASELEKEAPSLLGVSVATPRIGNPPLFVQGISVSAHSKNPELARAFAQYVTNNHNQVEFVKIAQGFFPGTQEGNSNPDTFTSVIKNDLQKTATTTAAEAMKTAAPTTGVDFTEDMGKYTKQQVALAVRGDVPIEDALQKISDYANQNAVK
ncbi:multiple sugar transport system substrate-binding protein [Actinobaculum suis]|uniref:Extracellular solute-binding protein n=1 Tax=Actinobaculum suis TaxID=1657 RepID=A0A0K9EVR0_9ACTO|nr:extracellular solute-binding protein [Actinobaculum suis]KMY24026.1 ABC transporter substrate-binding protein [Actinobaculum suis]MDY5153926.1 extracellular solute-binding protein [Actinobaculum suis]OCA96302.1 ABC transporter substrate-binding protein [Actinobaculum suis]OCA96341.1 ABC transporter substrate-binding protein [Actinobaculum suis]SDE01420.1 multiple sugar transport system substrate-binding protein [Actinobaculum suis]